MTANTVRDLVRERYRAAARMVLEGKGGTCCCGDGSAASCCDAVPGVDPITSDLYAPTDVGDLPDQAVPASLGCGNPAALASLREGEVVLDLGSGGGIDVLLSARRVGPTGFAYGLDMTDEMIEIAEANRAASGLDNVRFLKGHIEDIPLPDDSVDVIISNCVINLSGDKNRVLREAFRVLKPGGRLAVSDIVWRRPLPDSLRRNADLWAGCVAGALLESEYIEKLTAAGFRNPTVTPTRVYDLYEVLGMLRNASASDDGGDAVHPASRGSSSSMTHIPDGEDAVPPAHADAARLSDSLMSAFVRAEKPA